MRAPRILAKGTNYPQWRSEGYPQMRRACVLGFPQYPQISLEFSRGGGARGELRGSGWSTTHRVEDADGKHLRLRH